MLDAVLGLLLDSMGRSISRLYLSTPSLQQTGHCLLGHASPEGRAAHDLRFPRSRTAWACLLDWQRIQKALSC